VIRKVNGDYDIRMIDFGSDYCDYDDDIDDQEDNVLFCVLLFCIASCFELAGSHSYMKLEFLRGKLTRSLEETEVAMDRMTQKLSDKIHTIASNSAQSECIQCSIPKHLKIRKPRWEARSLLDFYLQKKD
jgi:hypothetical protein